MGKIGRPFLFVVGVACIGTSINITALTAQLAAPSQSRSFKSGVDLVALAVTVTDARERRITGLSKADFTVFEDGKFQEIAFLTEDPAPLDLAILLDTSGSMSTTLSTVQDAAIQLGAALRPGDRASFTEVKRQLRTLHPLSADFSGLARAIRSTESGGATGIYDAVYVALSQLQQAAIPGEIRRQALIVLSDGDDTASLKRFDDVLEAAKRANVAIYCVSLRRQVEIPGMPGMRGPRAIGPTAWDGTGGDYALRNLANQTGGQAFFDLASRDLHRVTTGIAGELANQYSLGYVPANPVVDGRYRRVSVRVTGGQTARARTRPGYFAARPSELRSRTNH
jgi:Ca-activated chloride channel homolog